MKCKLLIESRNIQVAIDEENKVFIRTYGRGYKNDCWGTWQTLDFNPKAWTKLDSSRIKPCENPSAWPIPQDKLDSLNLMLDLFN